MALILDDIKTELKRNKQIMERIGDTLDMDALAKEIAELSAEQEKPDFFLDNKRAVAVGKRLRVLTNKHDTYNGLCGRIADALEMCDMVEEMEDEELEKELRDTCARLFGDVETYNISTLLSGEYDACDCILTLHAGAGGTEAQDWTQMLYRMYTMYCERNGFKYRVLDILGGDEAGYKSVTMEVKGDSAYGYLKAERGVHRLVRISPFDANARRQTSFASLDVSPILEDNDNIEIRPEDLKVDTFRSSGAGGQHVNKTESAIRITHIPTGIIVACQNERSQIQNREMAMQMLKGKLAELREREREEKQAAIKGEIKKIEWGSQIRSYVFAPYTLVKDHRTGYEDANVHGVMDGKVEEFIYEYLRKSQ